MNSFSSKLLGNVASEMKALTERQVERVNHFLLRIERANSKEEIVGCAETIRELILQAEQVNLKFDC
jgi:hypothetical protein